MSTATRIENTNCPTDGCIQVVPVNRAHMPCYMCTAFGVPTVRNYVEQIVRTGKDRREVENRDAAIERRKLDARLQQELA